MKAKNTFTIHTELMDGTLSGVRNIYMGANSTCHLYVIPRDKINVANDIADIAGQPAFYILLGDPNALNPNRSLEKASCHFLMTAIRKTALYMLDS